MNKPIPNPCGQRNLPPPETLDPFQHPLNKVIDALLGSQPASMNDVFRELNDAKDLQERLEKRLEDRQIKESDCG